MLFHFHFQLLVNQKRGREVKEYVDRGLQQSYHPLKKVLLYRREAVSCQPKQENC
jgi:hypothetical protein